MPAISTGTRAQLAHRNTDRQCAASDVREHAATVCSVAKRVAGTNAKAGSATDQCLCKLPSVSAEYETAAASATATAAAFGKTVACGTPDFGAETKCSANHRQRQQ